MNRNLKIHDAYYYTIYISELLEVEYTSIRWIVETYFLRQITFHSYSLATWKKSQPTPRKWILDEIPYICEETSSQNDRVLQKGKAVRTDKQL